MHETLWKKIWFQKFITGGKDEGSIRNQELLGTGCWNSVTGGDGDEWRTVYKDPVQEDYN